jgi:ABC-2 type transport system ATP-binding protein
MSPQIKVRNLRKIFKSKIKEVGRFATVRSFFNPHFRFKTAVSDMSFEIKKGELVGFIGPNGAGKTTTLKMLSGLLYPTQGKISVLGQDPFEKKAHFLKQISLLMGQRRQLWWDLPVVDSLILNKEIYEISDKDFVDRLNEFGDIFDIKKILDESPRNLSLGERMKCEFLASILHKPKVMFLDEPTIGLDLVMQKQMRDLIKRFNEKYGATIMLTSHYMDDVRDLCRRVLVINNGELIYDGQLSGLTKLGEDVKMLRVECAKSVSRDEVEKFGFVEKFSDSYFVLKIQSSKVKSVSSEIFARFSVSDITVSEPDLEDTVRHIYQSHN